MGMGVKTWEFGKKALHTVTSKHLRPATVLVLALLHNLRPYDHYN